MWKEIPQQKRLPPAGQSCSQRQRRLIYLFICHRAFICSPDLVSWMLWTCGHAPPPCWALELYFIKMSSLPPPPNTHTHQKYTEVPVLKGEGFVHQTVNLGKSAPFPLWEQPSLLTLKPWKLRHPSSRSMQWVADMTGEVTTLLPSVGIHLSCFSNSMHSFLVSLLHPQLGILLSYKTVIKSRVS